MVIPSLYFPTTVLFIDSDVGFLKDIATHLSGDRASFNFYNDYKRALDLLNKERSLDLIHGLVNLIDEEEFEHRVLDINVKDLYRIMYNKDRFKTISTIVIDLKTLGLDGLLFSKYIKNPHIQKILLSDISDNEAIDMLNQGLINAFIKKDSQNMVGALNSSIIRAQNNYFLSLSQIFNQVSEISKDETALGDEAFILLFNKMLKETKAVEFYLMEWSGSFAFLDALGSHYGLMTKTQDQILSLLDSVQSESAPLAILDGIKNGQQLVCYHNEKNYCLPDGQVWEQYLFDAVTINGQKQYFCARGQNMFDIKRQKLITFDDYNGF